VVNLVQVAISQGAQQLQFGSGCKQPGRTAVAIWLWLQAARTQSSYNLALVASSQGAQQLQFGSGCKQPGRTAVANSTSHFEIHFLINSTDRRRRVV